MNTSSLYEAAFIAVQSNEDMVAGYNRLLGLMELPAVALIPHGRRVPVRNRFEFADPAEVERRGDWFARAAARDYEAGYISEGIAEAETVNRLYAQAANLRRGIPLRETRLHSDDRKEYLEALLDLRNILSINRQAKKMLAELVTQVEDEERAASMIAALTSVYSRPVPVF